MGSARLDDEEHLVESNDREAVREAVDKLIRDGHTRIGHVAGPDGFRSAREREAGLREALMAHGLGLPDEWRATGNYTFDRAMSRPNRF
jgi:LacI family transcriptional regulator